jgi:hypothetical protein
MMRGLQEWSAYVELLRYKFFGYVSLFLDRFHLCIVGDPNVQNHPALDCCVTRAITAAQ